MLKICHIITRLPVGGAQENTLLTCEGLYKLGYDVFLISGETKGEEGTLEKRAREICKNFIIIPKLVREISPIKDMLALYKIYKILKKEKFDIVHTHTSKAGIVGRIAAKLAGAPIVIHTPHGHIFHSYYGYIKTKIFYLLEKIAALFCDKIICLTPTEKKEHIELKIAPRTKFEVIPSGVDFDKFKNIKVNKDEVKRELGIEKEKFVVGCVSRLANIKGVNYLISAMYDIIQKNKNVILLLVGDGPEKENLEKLTSKLNIKNYVKFLGLRYDIPPILSSFDIFVLPSLNEGMGKAIIEAQLMGLAVIGSYVGGIKDIIEEGKTGMFCPPEDSKVLSEKILYLIENPHIARYIGEEAKKNVKDEYSSKYMVEKIKELYLKYARKYNLISSSHAVD